MWEAIAKVISTILTWGVNAVMWFIGGGWLPTLITLVIVITLIIVIIIAISLRKH